MISGIAGKSIVSPYIVTKSAEPNTIRVIHAEPGIFTDIVDVLLPLLLSGEEGDIGVSAKYIKSQSIEDFPNFNFGAIYIFNFNFITCFVIRFNNCRDMNSYIKKLPPT